MAASTELSFQVQEREARRRATAKAEAGLGPARYLTPNFLNYFPVVMESKADDVTWNEVSRLFRRRDAIPATFIDQAILVHEVQLGVFGGMDVEIAERRTLALFKLVMGEGDRYGITVVYIPSYQKHLSMESALDVVSSIGGNAVALAGMPKDTKQCAYMPEPANGEHYTLLPVNGDVDTCSGSVSNFPAAWLTKGSAHYRVEDQVVVKLPGSFTFDVTKKGLIDEEVFRRGPLWINKELIEVHDDADRTPVIIDDCTLAMEREIFVSNMEAYTNTASYRPLTQVACKPGYEPDHEDFTETVQEMQECVDKEIDEEREAQRQERIRLMQGGEDKSAEMDTTPA